MKKTTFGFHCGDFSVVLSGNGIVLPGSKNQPLRKSLLPYVSVDETAGYYSMRAMSSGNLVFELPVHVVWVEHPTEKEPFLGIKNENSEKLRETLVGFAGMALDLEFTPLIFH